MPQSPLEFKGWDAISNTPKDEAAASEEAFASIPLVLLDDMVGLSLDPPIEHDEFAGVDPTVGVMWTTCERLSKNRSMRRRRDEVAVG